MSQRSANLSSDHRPLVVGIGASAGGLEAFGSFFAKMPADAGLAFVLVQHLDPHHKSILTELISRQTPMAVTEAVDGAPLRANAVYVIPPDATLTIADGRLRVVRPAPPRRARFPIDSLFTSLAENLGEGAVGIILSGTGSDGTLGVRAIKAHGGLALAQAGDDHVPLSGMPQSAAATGLVDDVLKVDHMPARLVEYARHMQGVAPLKDGDGARRDLDDHLATISDLLRTAIGHDFGQYKRNTLARRVQRRMQVLQVESVPEFIERLRKDPPQLQLLFREFLIGVTQFFRDPDAFEALRANGLAKLFEDSSEPIRVWSPGCATGEEVYSLAILLSEEMERRGGARPVQIFGTDIDDVAVAAARTACYAAPMTGVSPERLERWFAPRGDGFAPIKPIREMCVFSMHSVIRDPPFSKLDLICCRNLMIYLDGGLQDKVLRSFHYALKPGGVLFLGPSEGLSHGSRLFSVIDKRHRIFERRQTDTPTRLPDFPSAQIDTPKPPTARDDRIEGDIRNALEKHSPAYVVIDRQYEVVRFSGAGIGRYLEPAGGPSSLNLFSLLLKTLRPVVRKAAHQVFGGGQNFVEHQISVRADGESQAVKVIAEPLGDRRGKDGLCLVAFQALGPAESGSTDHADRPPDIAALERTLETAKAQLLAATEDLEAAREEAASALEEQQSINEELQSSNEELETAKEEMQSINEELQTVNAELGDKNDQLTRSNSDLQNLLDSTQIATIFLDSELRVKGYTPAMTALFHLRDADRGRPLDEVVSRIAYGDLRQDVMGVLRDVRTLEREVEIAQDGATFIMRIRPYRTLDGAVDGVVITFVDITSRKAMEDVLREHAAIVEFSQDALISLTVEGRVRSWNPGAERLFGYGAAEAIGREIHALLGDAGADAEFLKPARAGRIAGPVATKRLRSDGAQVDVELTVMPISDADGAVTALAISARDIAERVEAEAQRTLIVRELGHRVKNVLSIVQAIAAQTARKSTPEAFISTFSARLAALAKTHDLLTREDWRAASLRDVIEAELAPYQNATGAPRWTCEGPDVSLAAQPLFALGMAFHELATNATKYGAFSNPSGRVEVTWTQHVVKSGPRLRLAWIETGGPPVSKPTRRGFGTHLITSGLKGDVALDFEPTGLRVSIDMPLTEAEAD